MRRKKLHEDNKTTKEKPRMMSNPRRKMEMDIGVDMLENFREVTEKNIGAQSGGRLGLIGRGINYSYSQVLFEYLWEQVGLEGWQYELISADSVPKLREMFGKSGERPWKGLNVTIPYKQEVIEQLDRLDATVEKIGACNVVAMEDKGTLVGYNTDYAGLKKCLIDLQKGFEAALVLGNGGASLAARAVLEDMGIAYKVLCRNPKREDEYALSHSADAMKDAELVIQCTPVGTYPATEEKVKIDYRAISKKHVCVDMVYNPKETAFMRACKAQGAEVMNGEKMLIWQALHAWDIWTR